MAAGFKATSRGARGAGHSVYVILLYDPRRDEPYGLYVGQTSRDPDLRFDQHKTGYKSSSAARRFGVGLLPDLTWLYMGLAQFPIYLMPQMLLPLARRIAKPRDDA